MKLLVGETRVRWLVSDLRAATSACVHDASSEPLEKITRAIKPPNRVLLHAHRVLSPTLHMTLENNLDVPISRTALHAASLLPNYKQCRATPPHNFSFSHVLVLLSASGSPLHHPAISIWRPPY